MNATVPDGFTVRAPTPDDLKAVTELINACAIAEYGAPEYTVEEMRSEWSAPGFDLASDAWLVVAPDGQLAGYANFWIRGQGTTYGEAYVHPGQPGRSIGTYLLGLIETRARQYMEQEAGEQITLRQEISGVNHAARQLLEQAGYALIRHDWRMEIDLAEAPPAPAWPDGIILRPFVPDQDEHTIHAATEEAFQYNRGFVPTPFERWTHYLKDEGFDPSLWFLAMDGTEVAGVALCRTRQAETETGWVNILAVRAPWRKRGLGMALLRQAFGEFYRRGIRRVGLSVDSENNTGATRLYERAGMRVTRQYDRYEKDLRS